ncbi:flavin-containing monooxygenase [Plakobranchus ocellatus]|uniref:Flavin-containing monooxygenase n=1 Tax=Plakobranchus ocellatus TaxID=259542 RepID=A0AAV4CS60_9GAST|nr:flavin-containing monooxygenase [Plakobranchus ocellatus]
MRVIKVAIIGAGGGGLCALRHLTKPRTIKGSAAEERPVQFEAVCFEQAAKVGGTWAYTDQIGTDKHGNLIHSSMYKNLKTNLPKECMAFPDFPFSDDLPSFIKHEDVQNYLEDYADNFDILQYIQFQRRVCQVRPVAEEGGLFGVRWEVATQSALDPHDCGSSDLYDAVIVCNGNYSIPSVPPLPGQESFQGRVMHSHDYRYPETFKDQVVVLLGANSSGQDIAVELSSMASKVYLSHNKAPLVSQLPDNMEEKPGIESLDAPNQVTFIDGTSVRADTLMLCTGYHYDYSFLAPECGIQVDDYRVTPMYKHLINTKHPSMAILGICKRIVPFPFFDVQVKFFRAVLEGSLILPSEADMDKDTDLDYKTRLAQGKPHRYSHEMSGRLFEYMNEVADLAGTERIPKTFEDVYNWAAKVRRTQLMTYKRMNLIPNEKGDGFVPV